MIEQEYGIKTRPGYPGNSLAKKTIERTYQVLGNLVSTYNLQETYVDDADPWMGILAAASFVVRNTYHRTKLQILGQNIFGKDSILSINHIENWKYMCQQKQA